ncbi:MAG: GDSL-type esterase/lipase family protein, partial [Gammaproteobacteria bacterium]|nr:GDSL-type esterase/lipase family protein [Gammaproteobacteria bacterium]
MKSRRLIVLFYVLAVHLFLFVIFWKPGFYHRINPFSNEHTVTYEIFYHNMLALQLRTDAVLQRRIELKLNPAPILFIGDSIIQGMCVSCISKDAVNFGIGLDTTHGVLERISQYQTLQQARAVVLAIGLNDTRVRNNDEILAGYRAILQRIPRHIPVIFSAVLPIAANPRWPGDTNDRIKALNHAAKTLCATRTGCHFVDYSKALATPHGRLAPDKHVGDGIHPNTDAYQA